MVTLHAPQPDAPQRIVANPAAVEQAEAALDAVREFAGDAQRFIGAFRVVAALPPAALLDHDNDTVLDAIAEFDVALTLLRAKAPHIQRQLNELNDVAEGRRRPKKNKPLGSPRLA